jgi:hypothetical protein
LRTLKRADYGAEERLLLCCARAEPCGAEIAELAGSVAANRASTLESRPLIT